MLKVEVIEDCIKGDRVAQEILYNFYASRMRGICLRYSRSVFEAEDIFQDGFIKVFTHLKTYKNQGGSFDGWVRRIILNTAIDTYKKNAILKNNIQYDELEEDDTAAVEIQDNLDEEDMLNVLAKLPDGYRIVFNLYSIEGFSHKEIAGMLDISESTSKSQLFKARKQIQNLLHIKYKNDTRSV